MRGCGHINHLDQNMTFLLAPKEDKIRKKKPPTPPPRGGGVPFWQFSFIGAFWESQANPNLEIHIYIYIEFSLEWGFQT